MDDGLPRHGPPAWVFLVTLAIPSTPALAAGPAVGSKAPAFSLETLRGQQVGVEALQSKPTVLVVARSRAAAQGCKDWVDAIDEELGPKVATYQVIVALKPWFMPAFVVRRKVEALVPRRYHQRVLLEWRDRFARQFDIPKDSTPTVLLLDRKGVVRFVHRGKPTRRALERLHGASTSGASVALDAANRK